MADFGGVIAAELRLPDAVNRRYLSPFQYFGIDDDTDLRSIAWSRGRYDHEQLTNLYTHNSQRVRKILSSLLDVVTDIRNMRALAFCVSRRHADYMCEQFLLYDIRADVLTSDNSDERYQKQQAIRSGTINILCVVDIFNEGVDIPEIDTLLFLRPTESLTLFLQQLGRGLRLSVQKECCTVLDFVGNSRPEYDFSQKFRALIGKTNKAISEEVKQGFPHAPLGCRIELSKRTQEMVLSSIRQATLSQQRILGLIRQYRHSSNLPLTLRNFLKLHPEINPEDLYKRGTWTSLVKLALSNEVKEETANKLDSVFEKAISRIIKTCDCYQYLRFLKQLAESNFRPVKFSNIRHALMCQYDFWQKSGVDLGFSSIEQSIAALSDQHYSAELADLLDFLLDGIKHAQTPMPNLPDVPLQLHARYSREQILVGFGATTFERKSPSREGVLLLKEQNIELLFVTLNKNEKQFSPTTMYHDYAINDELFHWQTQNSARPDRGRGLEYIQHRALGKRIFLFVREQAKDEFGKTLGFVNFGEVNYVQHSGAQPMNVTWRLSKRMPAFMWQHAAKLAIG